MVSLFCKSVIPNFSGGLKNKFTTWTEDIFLEIQNLSTHISSVRIRYAYCNCKISAHGSKLFYKKVQHSTSIHSLIYIFICSLVARTTFQNVVYIHLLFSACSPFHALHNFVLCHPLIPLNWNCSC